MLRKLPFEHSVSTSNKNILIINVGGQIITTHMSISNFSKLMDNAHVFIDYLPSEKFSIFC